MAASFTVMMYLPRVAGVTFQLIVDSSLITRWARTCTLWPRLDFFSRASLTFSPASQEGATGPKATTLRPSLRRSFASRPRISEILTLGLSRALVRAGMTTAAPATPRETAR